MMSATFSDYLTPPCPQIHATSLTKLLTMSAFEGTPLPPQCGRHKWKPQISPGKKCIFFAFSPVTDVPCPLWWCGGGWCWWPPRPPPPPPPPPE